MRDRPLHVLDPVTVALQLEERSEYVTESGCRIWTRAVDSGGYGSIHVEGFDCKAHRVAWVLSCGSIPEGLCVLHHCDVPACINVSHLFLGDRDINNKDKRRKGRQYARFTDDEIRSIRADPRHYTVIALEHKVKASIIWDIKKRRYYKGVL